MIKPGRALAGGRLVIFRRAPLSSNARAYYMRRVLAAADAVAVMIAIAACQLLEGATFFQSAPENALVLIPFAILGWAVLAGASGMYHVDDRRIDCSSSEEMFPVVQLAALWIWLVLGVDSLLTSDGAPAVTAALSLGVLAAPTVLVFRASARRWAQRFSWYRQTALIVGSRVDCERVRRTIARHPEYGLRVLEELHPLDAGSDPEWSLSSLVRRLGRGDLDRVIFASNYEGLDERTGALRSLAERGVKVDLVPGDSDVFRHDAELHHIEGLPLLTLPNTLRARSAEAIKRAIDLTLAVLALVVSSPLFLLATIAIRLESPGRAFFRQERLGRKGQTFEVIKFRTMVVDAEERKAALDELNVRGDGMFKIPNDPRITKVGRLLRKVSLDELPQLFNVIRGEMSIVGPRPLIPVEGGKVEEHYLARFDVRPGITGPWQVLGRSDIPFEDMVKLDYTYVVNWTLAEDFKLMARTLSAMGSGRGAY